MNPRSPQAFALLSVLLAAGLVACAAAAPVPGGPEPYHAEPGGTIWREDGSTTWLLPDGQYVWQTPTRTVWSGPPRPGAPTHHGPLFAATATPSTWTWVPATVDAAFGLMATGAGTVYELHCSLTAISGSGPFYVMAIDTSASGQPGNGTAPLAGGVSGGLSAVGNDVTFSDQTYPALLYRQGLMLALSSTADTYTAPAGGNQVRCDAKLRVN